MNLFTSRLVRNLFGSSSALKHLNTCCWYSAGIIPRESTVVTNEGHQMSSSLPTNMVVMVVSEEKIETNEIQHPYIPIPEDCEIARKVDYQGHMTPPRAWLDSFQSECIPTSAVELHPEVFACNPRMDFLNQCREWQEKFKEVDYAWAPTRAEMGRGRKKPWPQKGTGRARHGSRVAPQWKGGGIAHGPRGPKALFQKIDPNVRLGALRSALSIKFVQNNLLIVNDLSISSSEPEQFQSILAEKNIGESSALLVFADTENLDESCNVFSAVADMPEINLMPLVALNVWSLLHHEWLVLTLPALDDLEAKVTWNLHRYNWIDKPHNYYRDLPFQVRNSIPDEPEAL